MVGEIGWVGRFRFDLIWVVKGEGGRGRKEKGNERKKAGSYRNPRGGEGIFYISFSIFKQRYGYFFVLFFPYIFIYVYEFHYHDFPLLPTLRPAGGAREDQERYAICF